MKRTFDVVFSIMSLILLMPAFFIVGVLILVCDGKPIVFRQTRVGVGGTDFEIYKFRTMSMLENETEARFDAGQTHRVTGIGSVLRRTKLDEIPQLFNVLRGDMSIVGPRPEIRKWVLEYPEEWAYIHKVRPGITDPASIVFRNEEALLGSVNDPNSFYREQVLPRKIEIYKSYVSNQSFWGDMLIIVKTVFALVSK